MASPEDNIAAQKWMRIALINLLIVASLGVIMRYKIAYSLPFIEQENFLHAHSHFAFSGWITQALMTLMIAYLARHSKENIFKKYKWLLLANLISAYGMLLSFPWEGYGIISVIFSTLTIFVSYVFAFIFWKDLNKLQIKKVSHYWFKAALVFNIFSSLGPFFLSYMMANNISHPNWYLASTYYFLHFQYNGWFFFGCMGLLSEHLNNSGISFSIQKKGFWLFAIACIPAYFLSALWLPIPLWIYIIVVLAALSQLLGWVILVKQMLIKKSIFFNEINIQTRWIFILSGIALSIKLLLQAASTIPSLSKFAFGFRPVVIGYLHLVLLGVITLFIIAYSKIENLICTNRTGNAGIVIFIIGIILNELFLLIQGSSYMIFIGVPYINQLLLVAALCMFSGLTMLISGLKKPISFTNFNHLLARNFP
jgi:hypothetical protein